MATIQCNGVLFENVHAIAFDKDGTLADSLAYLHDLGRRRAQAVNVAVPGLETAVLQSFGFSDEVLNPAGLLAVGSRRDSEIGVATLIAQTGHDWMDALAIAQSAFRRADTHLSRKADLTPPFDGISDLVRSLYAQDLKLAIISSDIEPNIQDFALRYDLAPYFHGFVGTQNGLSKPDPRLLKLACSQLDVDPQTLLVIGDAIADIQLAIQGGAMGSIGVTWGGVTSEKLRQASAIAHHVSQIQIL